MPVMNELSVVGALVELFRSAAQTRTATINLTRKAVMAAPRAGPYTIPGGASLKLSTVSRGVATNTVALTSGSRTAAQVAADINAVTNIASVDTLGRLVLTSSTAPSGSTSSVVSVGVDGTPDSTGALSALGWDPGGQFVENSPIVAPTWKGISDGFPLLLDPSAIGPGSFFIVLGDRSSQPLTPDVRTSMYVTRVKMAMFRAEMLGNVHRTREPITSCLRIVREMVLTDLGRMGGRPDLGITKVQEISATISGEPIPVGPANAPAALYDIAEMVVDVFIYGKPDST